MSLRAVSRVCGLCRKTAEVTRLGTKTQTHISWSNPVLNLNTKPQILSSVRCYTVSDEPSVNVTDYPADVEVSYDEFKFVEQILPKKTVPEIPHHASYPTPSGWIPPNDEIRSKQPYLVRRTKNHVLPVYPAQKEVWKRIKHHVIIKNIEGDIWKLESELREYLQDTTKTDKIKTQVHEVSRCIRIRGEHTADIAQFLLDKGM